MQQIYINDFKIHDLDDPALQFFVQPPIKGLEFPDLRINSHNKAGQDGISVNSIYLGERRVQLTGKVVDVGSQANHVVLRRSFLAALAPQRDSTGLPVAKLLRFTALDGTQYQLEGQVVGADMDYDQVRHSTFLIDFLATRPTIDSYDEFEGTISTLTHGGFVLPAVLPVTFSGGTGGNLILTNEGDTVAPIIITLAGALTNPRIYNATTDEWIALTLSLGSSEELTIDTLEHTVVQGESTNRISTVSDDSTYFGLAPGDNELHLTTSVSGETGTATIRGRHAFIGV